MLFPGNIIHLDEIYYIMIVHNDGSDDDGRSISNKVSPWPASVPPPAAIPSPRRRPAATVPIAQQPAIYFYYMFANYRYAKCWRHAV